jgi:two-component system, OmpR family, response regulator CpxR
MGAVGRSARRILAIEDDADLGLLMRDYFAQHGFQVEAAHDGRVGLARALEGDYDLIILDVMLPVLDGFEVLRQLRKKRTTPVIMLTARTEAPDRIAGLNAGADDYLPKPFGPEELLARIRAVLRRAGHVDASHTAPIELGGLAVDPQTREVRYGGRVVETTSIEFDILELLVRSAGRTVTRDELSTVLHQRQATPYERSLDVHVSHLRKKLEGTGGCSIRTVRGAGYQFAAGKGVE